MQACMHLCVCVWEREGGGGGGEREGERGEGGGGREKGGEQRQRQREREERTKENTNLSTSWSTLSVDALLLRTSEPTVKGKIDIFETDNFRTPVIGRDGMHSSFNTACISSWSNGNVRSSNVGPFSAILWQESLKLRSGFHSHWAG